jgi:hypothetical protein
MTYNDLEKLSFDEMKAKIQEIFSDYPEHGFSEIVVWFEEKIKQINLLNINLEEKKLIAMMVDIEDDWDNSWWKAEEEYDDDWEEKEGDPGPQIYCKVCGKFDYVHSPNDVEHDSDCAIYKLGSILSSIDFSKTDYSWRKVKY